MDFNLQWDHRHATEMVQQAQKFGLQVITFNWKGTITELKKMKPLNNNIIKNIRILYRITLIIGNDNINDFNNISKWWDILAIQPITDEIFIKCCRGIIKCDIISLILNEKLHIKLIRKDIEIFIHNQGFFELIFNQALHDDIARRYMFRNSLELIRVTRGKNIIITSGARNIMEMRSHEDLKNFGKILEIPSHLKNNELFIRKIDDTY